jgi:hypothetical protein
VLADGARGLVDDLVVRGPPILEREVEAGKLELEADDFRPEDADRLLQQFLPGFVPF